LRWCEARQFLLDGHRRLGTRNLTIPLRKGEVPGLRIADYTTTTSYTHIVPGVRISGEPEATARYQKLYRIGPAGSSAKPPKWETNILASLRHNSGVSRSKQANARAALSLSPCRRVCTCVVHASLGFQCCRWAWNSRRRQGWHGNLTSRIQCGDIQRTMRETAA
jgi:hypothetical protein